MWLRFKISCPCQCSYSVGENITANRIACPNCGLVHPHSDKLIAILKTANEINDSGSEDEAGIEVIPLNL